MLAVRFSNIPLLQHSISMLCRAGSGRAAFPGANQGRALWTRIFTFMCDRSRKLRSGYQHRKKWQRRCCWRHSWGYLRREKADWKKLSEVKIRVRLPACRPTARREGSVLVHPGGDLLCWKFLEWLKLKISNNFQWPIRLAADQTISRPGRFWSFNIGIWDLFEFWCLQFVILDTKLHSRAIYFWPGSTSRRPREPGFHYWNNSTPVNKRFIAKKSAEGRKIVITCWSDIPTILLTW